jgi:uncharacterized protein (DUF4415 family)
MGTKKTLTPENFAEIMSQAISLADQPISELDLSEIDMDFDSCHYVSAPDAEIAKPSNSSDGKLPACGTHPISIRVPAWVIRAFKAQASPKGVPYQTLMNRALRRAVSGLV